ncbi:MAG: glycerol-3-phosphate dehydrogenase [Proteobacteria bacterium]|nr:glycerol-3-phosphate dehydrogenase [Pseudomonadota bacterium]MDA1062928.1 glycerol-3-phosphate dehydrogenase [Pseudomonadota bacterium]
MQNEPFDVAIIGAGINGAGIARDAALRGLRVVVIEQDDLCSGTSAVSSRLIHGGLRYLEFGEFPLVFESLRERIVLRRIAPHLVKPLRITIPIYASGRRSKCLIRLGMIAYDLLSIGKSVAGHDMLDRAEILAAEPGLAHDGLLGAARYFDAQVAFAERLVLENLLAARAAGAEILTYHRVTRINIDAGQVSSLDCIDFMSQQSRRVAARSIVNAAGPWVDSVLAVARDDVRRQIGGTKGSHVVVGKFAGAPSDAFYVEAAADGRPFFIIPWNEQYLIGTTDIRFDGDLAAIRASRDEVDYLLAETNRVFPAAHLSVADVHYSYAGVRPLPRQDRGPESSITRRHIIRKHRKFARGLLSIIGGKLTTYRNLAEQTVNRLAKELGRKLPKARTRETLLPGAYRIDAARARLESLTITPSLSTAGVERLLNIYGGRALELMEFAAGEPDLLRCIDADNTVLAVEAVFALRVEMACTLVDIVYRRLMLGLRADQGRPTYAAIAALAAAEGLWDAARQARELAALGAYGNSLRL